MILKQFYLNCLAHASYLDRRRRLAHRRRGRSAARRRSISRLRGRARPADRARLPHALSRRLRRRTPRAARSRRRHDLSRRQGQGGVPVHAARRRRCRRVRPGPPDRARDAGPHRRIDFHSRLRPRAQRHRAARRPDRRHVVRRRRRPAGSAGRARLVGRRSRRDAVRLAADQAAWRCPTPASSTRRTAPARSAARR